ncbi:hypothetical protein AcV7_002788 [Taiwanofungus camphoratus]|nr:hypothetical protein AcV7_002788 [Antrodia cinnamomea]
MPPSSALQWTLIALPLAVLLAYVLTAFPPASSPLHIHPSLAALPPHSPSWHIYPEHFFPGGAYVELPHGTVRYWLVGPHNGTRVVLIHGLSVPAIIWKDVAPALAASGFRVLLYDLYGRGYSDAPQTTYDAGLYTTQLALLMQYVGWDRAHLAGVSMGGGIAAAFAAHFPHLAGARIALVASTGLLDPSEISRTSKFLSSPPMQLLTASYPFRVRALSILLLHSAVCDVRTRLTRASCFFACPFGSAVLRLRRSGRLCIAHCVSAVWLPSDRLHHVPPRPSHATLNSQSPPRARAAVPPTPREQQAVGRPHRRAHSHPVRVPPWVQPRGRVLAARRPRAQPRACVQGAWGEGGAGAGGRAGTADLGHRGPGRAAPERRARTGAGAARAARDAPRRGARCDGESPGGGGPGAGAVLWRGGIVMVN